MYRVRSPAFGPAIDHVDCDTFADVSALIEREDTAAGQPMDRDRLLLLAFVNEYRVAASTLGGLLNARGRGVPVAIREWENRLAMPVRSLISTRMNGHGNLRGWRLADYARGVALDVLRSNPAAY